MASLPVITNVPTEQDLTLYTGAPITLVCSAVDSSNNPIDMTGGTIIATIRAAQSHTSDLLATFTVTWVDQGTGQFNLSLTSEITDDFNWQGNAYWDVFFEDTNTPINYYPILWGVVTLQSDISY